MHKSAISLSVAALLLAAFSLPAQSIGFARADRPYATDIRRSREFEGHKGKEIARYDNSQHHLSEFDRELTRGHFNKGKLGRAISDVKDLVEHNTLTPELRDAITADLRDLRLMRAQHR